MHYKFNTTTLSIQGIKSATSNMKLIIYLKERKWKSKGPKHILAQGTKGIALMT